VHPHSSFLSSLFSLLSSRLSWQYSPSMAQMVRRSRSRRLAFIRLGVARCHGFCAHYGVASTILSICQGDACASPGLRAGCPPEQRPQAVSGCPCAFPTPLDGSGGGFEVAPSLRRRGRAETVILPSSRPAWAQQARSSRLPPSTPAQILPIPPALSP